MPFTHEAPAGRRIVSAGAEPFPELDGDSAALVRLKQHMHKVARDAEVTVLVFGESGTGKERVARAIHRASPRRNAPFVVVNCAGLSPTLVEDELFGHVRGAFTGAIHDQPGPFERATGGTVFLDEVGELPPEIQVKLLRALQERTVQRLGGRHETAFDVRVIAATHVDLATARDRGRFRDDLYYRLKVYELKVPPLRQRGPADLRSLATAIVRRLCARRDRLSLPIGDEVLAIFARHRWPGNVRELENTLERMVVAAADDPMLLPEHLPDGFASGSVRGEAGEESRPLIRPTVADARAALERHSFNRRRAAAELGLSRHQLYRLLKRPAPLSVTERAAPGEASEG
jgi:transcriptional regulator with PAS, ATPase and Fis domain